MIYSWLGALSIGLALGLLGSGGSILTVPVLVYLVGQDEKTAIAGSLFIVGTIAAAGGIQFARQRQVDWRSVVLFGLPGMVGTYLGAWLGGMVSGPLQLTVFALVMFVAAALMFRPAAPPRPSDVRRGGWKVALDGLGVGVLTGFVGVGGGFLIVPALVLLGGLPMHLAVGTSLVVIALKSYSGFFKYLDVLESLGLSLDWTVLLVISAVGIAGSIGGRMIGSKVSQPLLRRLFAIFLVVIGLLIFWQSVPKLL